MEKNMNIKQLQKEEFTRNNIHKKSESEGSVGCGAMMKIQFNKYNFPSVEIYLFL